MHPPDPAADGGAAAPELSILIPVYNERATIGQVLEGVGVVDFGAAVEIVVVDDGSTDGTAALLDALPQRPGLRIIQHGRNSGKGSAIQTALSHARGRYVVIQDADLELDPRDLVRLFATVRDGGAPVCYGSRFAGDCRRFRGLPTYWANRLLTLACNLINGLHLTDMNTCYKMMRADVARQIRLASGGFAMEPEITTKLARLGVRIVERPIRYFPRTRAQGKKIHALDLLRYLLAMIRFRYFPLRGTGLSRRGPRHS